MNRVSSNMTFQRALEDMRRNQLEIARLQAGVGNGKRIQKPSDDPAAATRALDIGEALHRIEQYGTNSRLADQRLALEDSTLDAVQGVLIRVKELALGANSGTQTPQSRFAFGSEVEQRLSELLDLANVRDANGDYLFSGFQGTTRPFSMNGAAAQYNGDQGERELQIAATRRVQVGDSGDRVFMRMPGGNGRFSVSAVSANTGTGVLAGGRVTDPTAYTGDAYSVRFTAAGTFDVVNDTLGVTVLAAQSYSPGASIAFDGIDTWIDGVPAAGDRFDISSGGATPVFDTLQAFADAMRINPSDAATEAQLAQTMNGIIDSLDQALNHVLEVRAEVGARQNAIESIGRQNADQEFELESTLAEVEGLDMTEAISTLQQRITALEAVQASFAAVSRLSLFDYLR
jgi:flagellar hook-associated protein 3 FlgL